MRTEQSPKSAEDYADALMALLVLAAACILYAWGPSIISYVKEIRVCVPHGTEACMPADAVSASH